MAQTELILLERVESLGNMGDIVRVRPGFARNYLLPQKKALRATDANKAHFEAQRKVLEQDNAQKRTDAEKQAKGVDGLVVALIRQAAEGGQLYGSVSARDIADAISAHKKGTQVDRTQVRLNQSIKTLGLFPLEIALHPEVKLRVTINIARSEEEAKTQEKTGKAIVQAAADAAASEASAADAPEAAPKAKRAKKSAAAEEGASDATDSETPAAE